MILIRTTGVVALRSMRGAMKTLHFLEFVARHLVPRLRRGDIVVLDNLRQHKDPLVRQMIENVGAEVLYLPPYSPEYNPIEPFWNAFKSRLRRVAARTTETLLTAIGALRRTRFSMQNFFTHCGYA